MSLPIVDFGKKKIKTLSIYPLSLFRNNWRSSHILVNKFLLLNSKNQLFEGGIIIIFTLFKAQKNVFAEDSQRSDKSRKQNIGSMTKEATLQLSYIQ